MMVFLEKIESGNGTKATIFIHGYFGSGAVFSQWYNNNGKADVLPQKKEKADVIGETVFGHHELAKIYQSIGDTLENYITRYAGEYIAPDKFEGFKDMFDIELMEELNEGRPDEYKMEIPPYKADKDIRNKERIPSNFIEELTTKKLRNMFYGLFSAYWNEIDGLDDGKKNV
jgi:hypothetical protein